MHHVRGDLMALRAGFVVISILLGLTVGYVTGDGRMLYAAAGAGFGALLSGALVSVEISFLERLPARTLVYGGIGFSLGMLLSGMCIFLTLFLGPHPVIRWVTFTTLLDFPVSRTRVGCSLWQGVRWGRHDHHRLESGGTISHAQITGYERDYRRPYCRPV